LQVSLGDVFPFAFWVAIHKSSLIGRPVQDDRAEAAGPSFTRPRNALLNHPAAKIGIDQTALSPIDRFAQRVIGNPLFLGKALKRHVQKDPQSPFPRPIAKDTQPEC
jgi:hypothetical protein